MEGKQEDLSSVGVAVRVRPLNHSEKAENSQVCVLLDQAQRQLIMGRDRVFQFDQLFGTDSKQVDVFEKCTKDLVTSVFSGYNATVLAYGQTGSGKTYTMGSGQVANIKEEDIGIIPRVISMIFQEVEKRKSQTEFIIKVSFLEIYNEEIHDLLDANSMVPEKPIAIREDKGSIFLMGLHEEKVANADEMLMCLERGTLHRIVASTLMNAQSSRSHAIFTINIEQQVIEVQPEVTEGQEYMTAKFHFVDLAGSERAKRTGAIGAVLKEGISINKGLLCLGNVISALTEDSHKKAHVPYRDSKLTRILQDSLGGNAKTYMIACISPAEINFEETLNTLKYASRARNIKNKPVINRDPQSAKIAALQQEVNSLKQEIRTYQKIMSTSGNEDIKACLESMKRDFSEPSGDELKVTTMKLQQAENKLLQANEELDSHKNLLIDLQLQMLVMKKDRDLLKINLEKCTGILKANRIEFEEEPSGVGLVEEYNEIIEKLKRESESKDGLIKELQRYKEGLEKSLEREKKMLQKKTEELNNLKRGGEPAVELNEALLKNVDEYGRIFAETIMATINKQDSFPGDEIEETEQIEPLQAESEVKVQQEELANVEVKIREKEEIMKNIEVAFRDLQSQLIDEMSKQYYKKIEEIEIEKRNTERDRDLALEKIKEGSSSDKQEVAEKFKAKIQLLEEKLKENKRKDREMTTMQKLVETQKVQLSKLDEEIRKSKTDRIRLQKKIKEESEEIHKWKSAKQKEILLMKRNGLKKDQQIQQLKSENRRNLMVAKKKADDFEALQRRQKVAAARKKNQSSVDMDTLKQWVKEYIAACLDEREMTIAMNEEIQEKEEYEKEAKELCSVYTERSLRLERFKLMLEENETGIDQDELYSQTRMLSEEILEIEDRIDCVEGKIKRRTELILGYSSALSNSRIEEIKSRALTINTLEESQRLVTILFEDLLLNESNIRSTNKLVTSQGADIEKKNEELLRANEESEMLIKNYESELSRIKQEFRQKELSFVEEISRLTSVEDLESKEIRKSLTAGAESKKDESKCTTADFKPPEEEKQKSKTVFSSLSKARELKKRKTGVEEEEKKIRKSPINSRISLKPVQEEDSSLKVPSAKTRTYSDNDPATKSLQKWKLLNNVDAQKGPIYSMITQENILYTASSQTIKVWSLDTLTSISEFSAHNSYIKSLSISPVDSIITSSCGNIIKLWDTVSLQIIGQLSAPMEEVRVVKLHNSLLYSVGKSNEVGNSVCIWDIRKNQVPIFESERAQDIYALSIFNDQFLYSRKSNNVCKWLPDTQEPQVYSPGHSSTVTSITNYANSALSCSRDRSIKMWDSLGNCVSSIQNAHTDAVNCLATDCLDRQVYSGGKEGKIKVWRVNEELKLVGELIGLNTSVLCIAPINDNDMMIVSAGIDKSFRIWKLLEDSC